MTAAAHWPPDCRLMQTQRQQQEVSTGPPIDLHNLQLQLEIMTGLRMMMHILECSSTKPMLACSGQSETLKCTQAIASNCR